MAYRLAWSWAYSHCAGWRNHIPCSYWASSAASLLLDIHEFVPKKNPPLTRSKRKNWEKQGIPQEFVAKQRLHSIKGDHQPLTPVPIDLQLGSPPHEIQAFNLGTIEGSYKVLQIFAKKKCQAFLLLDGNITKLYYLPSSSLAILGCCQRSVSGLKMLCMDCKSSSQAIKHWTSKLDLPRF